MKMHYTNKRTRLVSDIQETEFLQAPTKLPDCYAGVTYLLNQREKNHERCSKIQTNESKSYGI